MIKIGDWVKEAWTKDICIICAIDYEENKVYLARETAINGNNIFSTEIEKVEPISRTYIKKSSLPTEEEIEIICIDKAGYMYPNQVKAIAKAIHKRLTNLSRG